MSRQRHLETATRDSASPLEAGDSLQVPTLTVLWHPDPERIGEIAALTDLLGDQSVELSRLTPRFVDFSGGDPEPLGDPYMSRKSVSIEPCRDGVRLDPFGVSVDLDGKRMDSARELSSEELRRGAVLRFGRAALLLHFQEPVPRRPPSFGLIGESSSMIRLRQEIARLVDLPYAVLLSGESGTGKELIARALHDYGPRRDHPYAAVNLGSLSPELAAAELFGVERGAFTGADRRREGLFREAGTGTLFLDEIGEAPAEVQTLLLRALETGEIRSLGAAAATPFSARILAATDTDLEAAMRLGEFRSPLFHRLAGYEIEAPPLRDRKDDIGRLLRHFLILESAEIREEFRWDSPAAASVVARLAAHSWPGNVRELRNAARQLIVASRGESELRLPESLSKRLNVMPSETRQKVRPEDISEDEVRRVWRVCEYSPTGVAKKLEISRGSIYNLFERYGIRTASDLSREEILESGAACGYDLNAVYKALQVSRRGLALRMKDLELSWPS